MKEVELTIRLDGCLAYKHNFPEFRSMVG